ncbi:MULTISPECIES: outer membrane protein [Bradyrhizobium]|uniref:Porin family protein n=1 Tax=Bradyrhizobium quebecense TaxID=2748629 RepID=A0A973WXE7_9BRAD|nr:outer membrane beta-barrel protein [Bradyrhizobium quebecense]UGA44527.1 outer membrane beta-barrel protein [Bradyrhizobium quebecense]
MRRFLLAAMMFGAVTGAQAADMPDFLRGSLPASSAPTRNWDGWYVGGQAGQTWINTDFGGSVASLTNSIFRNTTLQGPTSQFNLLGRVNAQSSGFGAFVGRNYQFDDVVVGVEANYTYWSGLTTTTSGSLGPIQVAQPNLVLPAGATAADGVTLNGSASLKLKDEMTFRGRAGWATGDFLPYVFGGLAVGRMDVSRTVTSSVNRTINFADGSSTTFALPQFAQTATDAKTDAYVAGWTAGLGLEYMLWNCVFVRGEWEYVKFSPVKNTSVTQNSVRAAIGYKF